MKNNLVEDPEVFYGVLGKYESTLTDPMRLVTFANKGLPASSFEDLINISHESPDVFAHYLNVSLKTLDRYHKDKRSLDPIMSELIIKWMNMYRLGFDVFGSVDAFNRWLKKPSIGLHGFVPFNIINISSGVDLVTAELQNIAHGDLS